MARRSGRSSKGRSSSSSSSSSRSSSSRSRSKPSSRSSTKSKASARATSKAKSVRSTRPTPKSTPRSSGRLPSTPRPTPKSTPRPISRPDRPQSIPITIRRPPPPPRSYRPRPQPKIPTSLPKSISRPTPVRSYNVSRKHVVQKITQVRRPPPIRSYTKTFLGIKTTPATNNPQVATQNKKKQTNLSPATNNPQVATQNKVTNGIKPTFLSATTPLTQQKLKTQETYTIDISTTPQNPNQSINVVNLREAINTKKLLGIKTTFTPTDQQVRILQAMEKQKQEEKTSIKSDWQIKRDKLDKKIADMKKQKQKTQEFKNRTNEEILQNFIKRQLDKDTGKDIAIGNIEQYAKQEGFDFTRTETWDLSPTKLDTPEKLREAGVAESIISTILGIDNPNNLDTGLVINTNVKPIQSVNYTGISPDPTKPKPTSTNASHTEVRNDFVPPVSQNTNKPVSNLTINTITSEGLGSVPQTSTTQTIAQASGKVESSFNKLPIPLLAGILLIGT